MIIIMIMMRVHRRQFSETITWLFKNAIEELPSYHFLMSKGSRLKSRKVWLLQLDELEII